MTALNRAILFVLDMDRMTAFYEELLGLVVTSRSETWTLLGNPGFELALHLIPEEYRVGAPAAAPEHKVRTDAPIKLCFVAEDPVRSRNELASRGISMRAPVRSGAVVYCDGADPEGNVFQLWSG